MERRVESNAYCFYLRELPFSTRSQAGAWERVTSERTNEKAGTVGSGFFNIELVEACANCTLSSASCDARRCAQRWLRIGRNRSIGRGFTTAPFGDGRCISSTLFRFVQCLVSDLKDNGVE